MTEFNRNCFHNEYGGVYRVPETALYSITVDYYPIHGNGATIERILLIDDKIPFNEARYMNFTRVWEDVKIKVILLLMKHSNVMLASNEMRL